ncbi:MAG: hypothetical protein JWO30_2919 [Fibrobacteres bacterium]|nr:hypothetical protein [Fibrobacterota bacterium]
MNILSYAKEPAPRNPLFVVLITGCIWSGKVPFGMPESVKRCLFQAVLACAGIILTSPPCARAQSSGPTLILELTDSTLIARTWGTVFPDSAAPPGEYQILIPSGPVLSTGRQRSATVFLLRNGTEVGSMDRLAWNALASASNAESDWATAMEGPEKQDVPLLWHAFKWNRETLLQWADWPAGFAVGLGTSMSAIRSSKPQYQRDIDFAWSQKPFNRYLLGAELHRSQFGGGLSRLGVTVADTTGGRLPSGKTPDFWGDAYWWWSLSAGVPGLKYTVSLANQPLPQYYWLDPVSVSAIRGHKAGRLVNQWTGPALQRDGNLSHTLDARLGILRYGIHWDQDAYSVPVQTAGMDDLPALFGTWGGGLIIASDILATRLWLDIPDLALKLGLPEAYPSRFRIAFLHFDMAYRNLRSFNLGVSVRVRVDNPIMNRPGA